MFGTVALQFLYISEAENSEVHFWCTFLKQKKNNSDGSNSYVPYSIQVIHKSTHKMEYQKVTMECVQGP